MVLGRRALQSIFGGRRGGVVAAAPSLLQSWRTPEPRHRGSCLRARPPPKERRKLALGRFYFVHAGSSLSEFLLCLPELKPSPRGLAISCPLEAADPGALNGPLPLRVTLACE